MGILFCLMPALAILGWLGLGLLLFFGNPSLIVDVVRCVCFLESSMWKVYVLGKEEHSEPFI